MRIWEAHNPVFLLIWFESGCRTPSFQGGLLHTISKKAGGSRAQDMRGIMILDGLGKVFHGMIRQRLLQWSAPRRLPTQFGGYQRQQTLFATQFLRAFVRTAERCNLSTTVLFLDVRSAFHCMVREHVFGHQGMLPARVHQCLQDAGLNSQEIESMAAYYATDFLHTADPCLQRVTQDAHTHTWYTLAHHDHCYQTHRGSRPGSPLADLAYNTMMQPLLSELQEVLDTEWRHHHACAQLGLASSPIAWVDDVAIPIVDVEAQRLDETTVRILQRVDKTFQQHGLSLNYAAGKTEAVIQYRGKAAPEMRERRFIEHLGQLPLGQGKSLRTVSEYHYLGTTFSHTVSMDQEIQVRIAKSSAAFRLMRKVLFVNRQLPIHIRLLRLDSLVTSILLHGAGNWPLLTVRQHDKLHAVMMKWYRSIIGTGFWSDERITDVELLARWQLPPLAVRLAKMRLLFAFKWYAHAPDSSFQVCTAEDYNDKSWFAALRHGVHWLATVSENQVDRTPYTTEDMMAWLHDHHHRGARLVRNAVHRYLLQQKVVFDVLAGHRRIWDVCQITRRTLHKAELPSEDDILGQYPCHLCARVFSSAQALQGHCWSWHQQCSDERLYVFSDTCPICNTCYWTSQRMQQHLKATRGTPDGCLAQMVRFYEPLEEPIQFDKPKELARFHRLPRCQVPGPANQPLLPLWRRKQSSRLDEYDKQWEQMGYPMELCPEYVEAQCQHYDADLREWQQQSAPDSEALRHRWQQHHDSQVDPKASLMAFFYWGRHYMYECVSPWEDPDDIQAVTDSFESVTRAHPIWQLWSERDAVLNWREPPDGVRPLPDKKAAAQRGSKECYPDSLRDQNRLLAPFSGAWATPVSGSRPVPILQLRDGTRFVVILHLFSGRRRPLDCGHWATEIGERYFTPHGIKVMMLAVDTAVDESLGNLAPGDSLSAMLGLAARGVFALSVGGPPCETWSSARHLALETGRGPRPLRSFEMSWCLPFLTARELRQVSTGNQLMLTELELEATIIVNGGDTMMEHPEEPANPEFASVWRIGLHQHLLPSLAPMVSHHVQQWKFGACAVKPTRIRTLGMARSYHIFQRNETPNVQKPESHLGGLDGEGKFRTAAAKGYPGDFCRALIDVALSNVARRYAQSGAKIVQESQLNLQHCDWLHQLWKISTVVDPEVTWKPDYQPQR